MESQSRLRRSRREQTFKVQVVGHYGEQVGAPVSALYQLRYAAVTEAGVGETVNVSNLDATAGYPEISDDAVSGCLNLGSGDELALAPDRARESDAWDLCLRRDVISVNGERGGPGNVTAVDLNMDDEVTLEQLGELTDTQTEAAFDAVDFEQLSEPTLGYRGDHVVSAFDAAWVDSPGEQARPVDAAWFVRGADGESSYLVLVTDVEGDAHPRRALLCRSKRCATSDVRPCCSDTVPVTLPVPGLSFAQQQRLRSPWHLALDARGGYGDAWHLLAYRWV